MSVCAIITKSIPIVGAIAYVGAGAGFSTIAFLLNKQYFNVSPLTLIVEASGKLSDEKTKGSAEAILKARLLGFAALTSAGLGIIWPISVAALIYKFLNPYGDFDAFFNMLFVPYEYLRNKVPARARVTVPSVLGETKLN